MKRLLLPVLVLFLIITKGLSQADFRKGFIIKNSTDTVRGYVNFKEGTRVFKECDFRLGQEQTTATYGPDQIVGYGFDNDKFFVSREVKFQEKTETVFLEVLVDGIARLYKHDQKYFIEKDTSGLLQLISEIKEIYINERRVLRNTNQYLATLNMLLFDCAEIRPKLQKIKLSERQLTELIKDYNISKGGIARIYKEKKPWSKASFGIVGGLMLSKLNFTFDRNYLGLYDHLVGTFDKITSPTIGLSYDVASPRITERFSLTGNILYSSTTFYRFSERPTPLTSDYVTLKANQLQLPLGFKYTFPVKKNIGPYLQLGTIYVLHTKSSSTWVREVLNGNIVTTTEGEALEVSKNQLGFWGGVGLVKPTFKKFYTSIEFRYTFTNGLSSLIQLPSKIVNLQLLVIIRTK